MPPPADSHLEGDASGEAWFQKGVTLLEGRKQEREIEEKLRKAMDQSVLLQWHTLLALILGIGTFWQIETAASLLSIGLNSFLVMLFIFSAIDSANAKRTQAILSWISHEREKEKTRLEGTAARD